MSNKNHSSPTPIEEPEICCLCGATIEFQLHPVTKKPFWKSGHNAQPLKDGRCCDVCNETSVVPYRIALMLERRKTARALGKPKKP